MWRRRIGSEANLTDGEADGGGNAEIKAPTRISEASDTLAQAPGVSEEGAASVSVTGLPKSQRQK